MIDVRPVQPYGSEVEAFLSLPTVLYDRDQLVQRRDEEEQIILGTHLLSHYFKVQPLVVYVDEVLVARAALFLYPQLEVAYVGYFEAKPHEGAVQALFDRLKDLAVQAGKTQLIGPVNASFWLSYRMKLSDFDRPPFLGEPHQLSYYPRLWEQAGFQLTERYLSTFYREVLSDDRVDKLADRYDRCLSKGYQLVQPKKGQWEQVLVQVYHLLSELYRDFPVFQAITAEEFAGLFASYRLLLDFSMVRLAYWQGKLVGFVITLPDYGVSVYRSMNLWEILRFLKRRYRAERYSVLYLGCAPEHKGLGAALTYPIFQAVKARQAQTIGALIHQGKVTAGYAAHLQTDQTSYGLYSCQLRENSEGGEILERDA